MDEKFQNLSLFDDEDDELTLDVGEGNTHQLNLQFSLVGRFLTEKTINFNAMKNRLASIWQPRQGITISEIPPSRYLFQFYHSVDMKRVLEGGPWTFSGFTLILKHLREGDIPNQVELRFVPLWVQIFDLPVGLMSENVGKQLGNFIGTVLEYDCHNSSAVWRNYMRIRVDIDVTKPIKRAKKIKTSTGNWTIISFKYEKLPTFCFICGLLGHNDKFCAQLFEKDEYDLKREWGTWLRAAGREADRSGERWLRTGMDDDRWPGKESKERGMIREDSQALILHAYKISSEDGNTEGVKQREDAGSSRGQLCSNVGLDSEDLGLAIGDDRKKRKMAEIKEAHPVTNPENMLLDESHTATAPVNEVEQQQYFFLAGSAGQTCQQP